MADVSKRVLPYTGSGFTHKEAEMESRNRTLWILVAVVAAAFMCCCALMAIAAFAVRNNTGWNLPEGVSWPPRVRIQLPGLDKIERSEKTFEVGSAPRLTIRNFAGNVTVRVEDGDTVRVVATKRARSTGDLDSIVVQTSGQDCCVDVTTSHPTLPTISSASVSLEVTVPPDAVVDLRTGAGSINVRDVQGAQRIETGAGIVEIRGAAGPVSVNTGAGGIDYEGSPKGECTFHAGAGTITLRLSADANVSVDLSAGLGDVRSDLTVSGTVTRRLVRGTIGTGRGASVSASAGVGSVELLRR
jgi:hypothetical protein